MILNIIIGLGAAFALFWTFLTRKLYPSVISLGMIAGVILVLLPRNILLTPGLALYIIFVFLAFFYGLFMKGLMVWPRIVICLMSASIITYWFWKLYHLHGNEFLFPVLTLIIGLAAIVSKAKLRNETGFLVILAADALAILIENTMWTG